MVQDVSRQYKQIGTHHTSHFQIVHDDFHTFVVVHVICKISHHISSFNFIISTFWYLWYFLWSFGLLRSLFALLGSLLRSLLGSLFALLRPLLGSLFGLLRSLLISLLGSLFALLRSLLRSLLWSLFALLRSLFGSLFALMRSLLIS